MTRTDDKIAERPAAAAIERYTNASRTGGTPDAEPTWR